MSFRGNCGGCSRFVRLSDALIRRILGWFHLCSLWHLFSFEILLHAFFRETNGPRQSDLRVVIIVESGNIVFVRAGDGFLRLDNLHRVGNSRGKTIARLQQALICQSNIALSYDHLLPRRFEVEQRGANVRIDLSAQVVEMIAALLKLCISDQDIAVNFAALEDRNTQSRAQVEYPMREEIRISSGNSVIAADGERRVITGVCRTPRIPCGSAGCPCGLTVP